jgi:hypothetical protein
MVSNYEFTNLYEYTNKDEDKICKFTTLLLWEVR